MARQKNNIIMRSTRGMVGKQIVFKRRAGKGYVAAPPEVNENRKPTEKQAERQAQFKKSIIYAKAAMLIAEVKQAYAKVAKRGQSAFNVAFQDAYNAPQVTNIVFQGYRGQIGDLIVVQAFDDFKVNAVTITIHNAQDELVEEGTAESNADGTIWNYTVTKVNPVLEGTRIRATAFDVPGNEGTLEMPL